MMAYSLKKWLNQYSFQFQDEFIKSTNLKMTLSLWLYVKIAKIINYYYLYTLVFQECILRLKNMIIHLNHQCLLVFLESIQKVALLKLYVRLAMIVVLKSILKVKMKLVIPFTARLSQKSWVNIVTCYLLMTITK